MPTTPNFLRNVALFGNLFLGEQYMEGKWHCEDLDGMFARIISHINRHPWLCLADKARNVYDRVTNLQTLAGSRRVINGHYELPTWFFTDHILDPLKQYSCGYWRHATDLASAQNAKLDLICRKIGADNNLSILDVGCGWGGFAYFACTHSDCKVTGVSNSAAQLTYAKQYCEGLRVRFERLDYRELPTASHDRIVSVGMFEHVGPKNYVDFMLAMRRSLKPDGLFLLHFIGSHQPRFSSDPWMQKYIFPGGVSPSLGQIERAIRGLFAIEDVHNFGSDYDPTTLAWRDNLENEWTHIRRRDPNTFDERFRRMFYYYLSLGSGNFRAGGNSLYQVVLSPLEARGGYRSVR